MQAVSRSDRVFAFTFKQLPKVMDHIRREWRQVYQCYLHCTFLLAFHCTLSPCPGPFGDVTGTKACPLSLCVCLCSCCLHCVSRVSKAIVLFWRLSKISSSLRFPLLLMALFPFIDIYSDRIWSDLQKCSLYHLDVKGLLLSLNIQEIAKNIIWFFNIEVIGA